MRWRYHLAKDFINTICVAMFLIFKQKSHIYWPEEKTRPIHHGPFQLNLQSERKKKFWMERIVNLSHKQVLKWIALSFNVSLSAHCIGSESPDKYFGYCQKICT